MLAPTFSAHFPQLLCPSFASNVSAIIVHRLKPHRLSERSSKRSLPRESRRLFREGLSGRVRGGQQVADRRFVPLLLGHLDPKEHSWAGVVLSLALDIDIDTGSGHSGVELR